MSDLNHKMCVSLRSARKRSRSYLLKRQYQLTQTSAALTPSPTVPVVSPEGKPCACHRPLPARPALSLAVQSPPEPPANSKQRPQPPTTISLEHQSRSAEKILITRFIKATAKLSNKMTSQSLFPLTNWEFWL